MHCVFAYIINFKIKRITLMLAVEFVLEQEARNYKTEIFSVSLVHVIN